MSPLSPPVDEFLSLFPANLLLIRALMRRMCLMFSHECSDRFGEKIIREVLHFIWNSYLYNFIVSDINLSAWLIICPAFSMQRLSVSVLAPYKKVVKLSPPAGNKD